jgi:hypothetical protein
MTLDEIAARLPNGFHDAEILELVMNYESLRLLLRVNVLVGLPNDEPGRRDSCRAGEIVFEGVRYFSVEPPRPDSSFRHPGAVGFSYEKMESAVLPPEILQKLPPETKSYSLFVREWLSHVHIAAGDLTFLWAG